jgi:hypothetical protein
VIYGTFMRIFFFDVLMAGDIAHVIVELWAPYVTLHGLYSHIHGLYSHLFVLYTQGSHICLFYIYLNTDPVCASTDPGCLFKMLTVILCFLHFIFQTLFIVPQAAGTGSLNRYLVQKQGTCNIPSSVFTPGGTTRKWRR